MADIAPLKLFEYDHAPGTWCLMLTDDHMVKVMGVFEEMDRYGNGYNWEAVARQAVRAYAPECEGLFDFDPEASMFIAFGEDRGALERLGELLARALRDRELLEELLRDAEEDWFD